MDISEIKTAEEAYHYIFYGGRKSPKLVKLIATDAYYSYLYALYVLKAPFTLGEKAIATDVEYSYQYARDVLIPNKEKITKDHLRSLLTNIDFMKHSAYEKFVREYYGEGSPMINIWLKYANNNRKA